jgi:transcriptional regulator with XRE-family HTH domain
MTYAAIAEKLGTSAAYVSKVFRGDENFTIESMVKLARSTDSRVSIQIVNEKFDAQRWVNRVSSQPKNEVAQPVRTPPTVVRIDKYRQNGDAPRAA